MTSYKASLAIGPKIAQTKIIDQPGTVTSRQRAVSARVGAATQDILALLRAYHDAAFARIDGEWGDVDYRMQGFDHQLVAICLFGPMFEAWREKMAGPMQNWVWQNNVPQWGPVGDFEWDLWPRSPDEWQQGLPRDPRLCQWDTEPELFAEQIELVAARVRAEMAYIGWFPVAPAEPWDPAQPTAPPSTVLEPYVEDCFDNLATDIGEAIGTNLYEIPVVGWVLEILVWVADAFIYLMYAIFGTAAGVMTPAVPLQPGEQDGWAKTSATVIAALQLLDDQCRAMNTGTSRIGARLANRVNLKQAATPAARKTRQVVAITIGTAAALALVWALMA